MFSGRRCFCRKCFISASVAASLAVGVGGCRTNTPAPPTPTALKSATSLADAQNAFGFDLLRREVAKTRKGENVFVSPLSIESALLLAEIGAGGATQTELARTLGVAGQDQASVLENAATLRAALLNAGPEAEVRVANALYANAQTNAAFKASYIDQATRYFGAKAETISFSPNGADTINGWVSAQTGGMIPTLLTQDTLEGRTGAVLVNAVYFKAKWLSPFDAERTSPAPFTLADGSTKSVQMMGLEENERFLYKQADGFQIACLPYRETKNVKGPFAMYIALPDRGCDVYKLVETLDRDTWAKWTSGMAGTELRLTLPRFKASYSAELTPTLKAMGVEEAFSDKADFAAMGLPGYFINGVVHKAVIEVDETGTKAAAATGVTEGAASIHPPVPEFHVDRPFVVVLADTRTGAVLFGGVIASPEGK